MDIISYLLGKKSGGGSPAILEEKEATITSIGQEITPSEGYNGISKVTIENINASVDSNIVAENIKKDVTILGVTGTLQGGAIIPPEAGTIVSLTVTQNPTKTVYYEGEDFDLTGCVITALYSSNQSYDVTNNCVYTVNVPLNFGDTQVKVEFEGLTTYIYIIVNGVSPVVPASTKLLMHCDGNLKNAITDDLTGITGLYSAYQGKFGSSTEISGSIHLLHLSGFGISSGDSNFGFGWWTLCGSANYGNVTDWGCKSGNYYKDFFQVVQSDTEQNRRFFRPKGGSSSPFVIDSISFINSIPTTDLFGKWTYYAIQYKENQLFCYVNGILSTRATISSGMENFNDFYNHSTSSNYCIDEVIITGNADIFQVHNAPWTLPPNVV